MSSSQNVTWNPLLSKLSSFNFQWTKTMCQNNSNNITFFFTFFKGYRLLLVICGNTIERLYLLGAQENKCQILVLLPVILGDFRCDLTYQACRENLLTLPRAIALSFQPPLVTRIAWTGLGTRLVKFHKNCENTGKNCKNSVTENFMWKMSFCEIWHLFSWAVITNFLWCYQR